MQQGNTKINNSAILDAQIQQPVVKDCFCAIKRPRLAL